MKAMIFAAGLGTRLKPITDVLPKALVQINGKPLLLSVIEKLKQNGFTDLTINVHHFAEQIEAFLSSNHNFGVEIHISDEREQLLETGGGIKKAAPFLDGNEPFLIHNVDIISNADLKKLYQTHLTNESIATLLVSNRPSSRSLLFDEQDRLCGWINHKTGEVKSPYKQNFDPSKCKQYAFSGIHVMEPAVFKWMEEWGDKFSIIDFYLSIADRTHIQAHIDNNLRLLDVGKIDSLKEADNM